MNSNEIFRNDVAYDKIKIHRKPEIRRWTEKRQFWKVLNISLKKTLYLSLFFNKVAGLHHQTFFKKRLLYRCFPKKFAKYSRFFFANTSGWLLLQNVLLFVWYFSLSHQMLPLNLFFEFYFNYFQSKDISFLNVLSNLTMNELIFCW